MLMLLVEPFGKVHGLLAIFLREPDFGFAFVSAHG
jgi:hypothetical protein